MEYTDSKWEEWLGRFCQQSSTQFSVHTGKQINTKQQHGMIQVQGECYNFKTEWSQMYNSALEVGQVIRMIRVTWVTFSSGQVGLIRFNIWV